MAKYLERMKKMNKALTDSLSVVKDAFVLVKAKIDPDVDTETNCCLMDVLEMLLDARDHIKNAAPDAPTSEADETNNNIPESEYLTFEKLSSLPPRLEVEIW
jgi:hypothetical protein